MYSHKVTHLKVKSQGEHIAVCVDVTSELIARE